MVAESESARKNELGPTTLFRVRAASAEAGWEERPQERRGRRARHVGGAGVGGGDGGGVGWPRRGPKTRAPAIPAAPLPAAAGLPRRGSGSEKATTTTACSSA